jgi:hypothetical protein
MTNQKPTRTFTLCDNNGTKYEVDEFTIVAAISGDSVSITKNSKVPTVAKDYKTSDGQYITFENGKYHLEESGTELYSCNS